VPLANSNTPKNKYSEDFRAYYLGYLQGGLKGFYITNTQKAKKADGRDYSLRIKPEGLTLILGKKNRVWEYVFESGETFCNGLASRFKEFYSLLLKVHADQKNNKIDCFIEK